jgi:hypothetical protein
MKLSQDKKRKYQIVTLLFSLLLGVGVVAFYTLVMKFVAYDNAIGMIIPTLVPAGLSWLSIRLAFAQWKNSHWMLLAMKMVLYFCGMITALFLIMMLISSQFYQDIEAYPLVVIHIIWFAGVFLLAIVLMIPFGFLSYWLSRLSSTESQENRLIEKNNITGTGLNENKEE